MTTEYKPLNLEEIKERWRLAMLEVHESDEAMENIPRALGDLAVLIRVVEEMRGRRLPSDALKIETWAEFRDHLN